MKSNVLRNIIWFLLGFHTMLPKSSGNCAGNISCWKWMQIGWNCKFAPQFDPLQVSWLVKDCVWYWHAMGETCLSKVWGGVATHNWGDWLNDWLAGWLAGWLTDWLADWLTDWLTDWLADWLTGWLTGWLAGWLTDWLAGWLTDRQTNWSDLI